MMDLSLVKNSGRKLSPQSDVRVGDTGEGPVMTYNNGQQEGGSTTNASTSGLRAVRKGKRDAATQLPEVMMTTNAGTQTTPTTAPAETAVTKKKTDAATQVTKMIEKNHAVTQTISSTTTTPSTQAPPAAEQETSSEFPETTATAHTEEDNENNEYDPLATFNRNVRAWVLKMRAINELEQRQRYQIEDGYEETTESSGSDDSEDYAYDRWRFHTQHHTSFEDGLNDTWEGTVANCLYSEVVALSAMHKFRTFEQRRIFRVRGNNKDIFEARKQGIISGFRSQLGLLIDKPKSGGPGTPNDDIIPQALIIQSAVQNLKVRIYKTVILPVVLYGCETWTLTLREEHRFRVFENKVLRKIFGAKRDEVTGEWRKLHNTELHALYSSPDIIRNIKSRRLRWAGHVARMGESRNAYRVLVGRPEEKDL
ncbi:hypothetical protein ANN_06958 [Periplaneta americana]|uniref:Uncharacterized protein n=1 Tax=Periplaneta americana TaxID=6978 RepID=A0ABQ8THE1_PERAM|nr:hypothetical protein ANN_06958 [Periplaneta americana]